MKRAKLFITTSNRNTSAILHNAQKNMQLSVKHVTLLVKVKVGTTRYNMEDNVFAIITSSQTGSFVPMQKMCTSSTTLKTEAAHFSTM
jgi:uncharacterized lipoprotein YajG